MTPEDRRELTAWLRLLAVPGVGRVAARKLLAAFGGPEAIFDASMATLTPLIGAERARALLAPGPLPDGPVTEAWLGGSPDRHVLTLGDPDYPKALLETADPPLLLFAQGSLAALQAPALAIVGSRHPTAQGRDNAKAFARELATQGWCIVSGLAQGVDGAAHEGAMEAGGWTVAVVGTGLDRTYPPRHQDLARRISHQGLMLSEYPLGTHVRPEHFPARNRIIAGLARGTLVVEAALQSGSLITARLAAECGREVMAIPGSIHSPQARGCHSLIKQGAKLVDHVDDILQEMGVARPPEQRRGKGLSQAGSLDNTESADPLLQALGHDPTHLDALIARTGWSAEELAVKLLDLELAGQVARLPGGLYQRRGSA